MTKIQKIIFPILFLFGTIYIFLYPISSSWPYVNNGYYFLNKESGIIKQMTLDKDGFDGIFYQINMWRINPKEIPYPNYFENWNLIGYRESDYSTITKCIWNTGIPNYSCSENVEKHYQSITLNDLSATDIMKNYLISLRYFGFDILLSVICNFFILFSLYKIFELCRVKEYYILISIFAFSIIIELTLYTIGLSSTQLMFAKFGFLLIWILNLYKLPFFILGYFLFCRKFFWGTSKTEKLQKGITACFLGILILLLQNKLYIFLL